METKSKLISLIFAIGPEPLERPAFRWQDKTETDIKELGCDKLEWVVLMNHHHFEFHKR
jgi:hypothetical protein